MKMDEIIQGDCLEILKTLPAESIDCCITSPPYWGLRDYGVEGQLGMEETPEAFVQSMVTVFQEVRRVLKPEGTLWLNLGDSYAGSWGNYGGQNRGSGSQRKIVNGSATHQKSYDGLEDWKPPTAGKLGGGIKPKDLVGIPWMVAFALRADGWHLRQDIIWHKPNPMPESVTDRCTKSHEYIFLLSKSPKYYFDNEAIREPVKETSGKNMRAPKLGEHRRDGNYKNVSAKTYAEVKGANRRSVWTITTKPFSEAHFATFPEKLISPMIKAGCPAGGIILDPFMGAGTTALVAQKLNRHYLGIELNPEYIKMAEKRLKQPVLI